MADAREQATLQPLESQLRDPLERARLLEEVCSAGHDRDAREASHLPRGLAIQLENDLVASADDQQRRCEHVGEPA